MSKLKGTLPALLLISLVFPWGPKATATTQVPVDAELLLAQVRGAPSKTTSQQQRLSWWNLLQKIFRKNLHFTYPPGGSRCGICLIALVRAVHTQLAQDSSPTTAKDTIPQTWSDRPLFVWKGRAVRIEVRSHNSQELMWPQFVAVESNQIAYAGKPLQPGQLYDGALIDQLGEDNPFTFRLMEAPEHNRITTELAALEVQLKAKGAPTEEIALQKANYFEQQLPSEVLREAFSLTNPPAELSRLRSQVYMQFCNSAVSE